MDFAFFDLFRPGLCVPVFSQLVDDTSIERNFKRFHKDPIMIYGILTPEQRKKWFKDCFKETTYYVTVGYTKFGRPLDDLFPEFNKLAMKLLQLARSLRRRSNADRGIVFQSKLSIHENSAKRLFDIYENTINTTYFLNKLDKYAFLNIINGIELPESIAGLKFLNGLPIEIGHKIAYYIRKDIQIEYLQVCRCWCKILLYL